MLLYTSTPMHFRGKYCIFFFMPLHYLTATVTGYFSNGDFTLKNTQNKVQDIIKDSTRCFQPLWPVTSDIKSACSCVPRHISDVYELLAVPIETQSASKLLAWFHFSNCSNDRVFQFKYLRNNNWQPICVSKLCFFFPPLPLIIWQPLRFFCWPFGGTQPLDWEPLLLTVYKVVQAVSTWTSYNIKMLLWYLCFRINNLIMAHRVRDLTGMKSTFTADNLSWCRCILT